MGEVGAIIDGILRHLPLFGACTVVDGELLSMVGWWFLGGRGKAGSLVMKSGGPLALKY